MDFDKAIMLILVAAGIEDGDEKIDQSSAQSAIIHFREKFLRFAPTLLGRNVTDLLFDYAKFKASMTSKYYNTLMQEGLPSDAALQLTLESCKNSLNDLRFFLESYLAISK